MTILRHLPYHITKLSLGDLEVISVMKTTSASCIAMVCDDLNPASLTKRILVPFSSSKFDPQLDVELAFGYSCCRNGQDLIDGFARELEQFMS